ncbi:MAG: hypothetical protein NT141_03950 [candidate division WWE3 bacterium]|nr:hypothetical protein [candidate division WWE3 bacterium]
MKQYFFVREGTVDKFGKLISGAVVVTYDDGNEVTAVTCEGKSVSLKKTDLIPEVGSEKAWKLAAAAHVQKVADNLVQAGFQVANLRWVYEPSGNSTETNADVAENVDWIGNKIATIAGQVRKQARAVFALPIWYRTFQMDIQQWPVFDCHETCFNLIPPDGDGKDWKVLAEGESVDLPCDQVSEGRFLSGTRHIENVDGWCDRAQSNHFRIMKNGLSPEVYDACNAAYEALSKKAPISAARKALREIMDALGK